MLLAAIAGRTTRIRLGSTSYLLPIRNPLLAAEEVAVLDRLSGGRVILGVGRGFQDALFKTFDIPATEKRERFMENLTSMISAWRGEAICEQDGNKVFLSPLPVQKPHPPLWVAAFGPLAIKQAGSLGLPYLASPVETLDSLERKVTAHRNHVAESGHSEVQTIPIMRTIFITDNRQLARQVTASLEEEAVSRVRSKAMRQGNPVKDWAVVGDRAYVKDKLAEYRHRLGLNYLIARGRIQGVGKRATDKIPSTAHGHGPVKWLAI